MEFITEEAFNDVVKAYDEQVTTLQNEIEALRAINKLEEQTAESNANAGLTKQEQNREQNYQVNRIFNSAKITSL